MGVYYLMVLTSLFWSGAFIAGKLGVHQFPPFALTFFRFGFALPIIFFILYKKQPDNWLLKRHQWKPIIILGIIGMFMYHSLFFTSLKYTTAINSSLIGAANPMITAILALMFFKEDLSMKRIMGMFISFGGVLLIVSNGSWRVLREFQFNHGDLIMAVAVICWALYSLLSRRFMIKYELSPLTINAYTFLVCTLISVPFVIWENPMAYLPRTTAGGWASILYMSVFASVLGYLFQLKAIEEIGASKTANFVNLVPVFTIIQSVVILDEQLNWLKLVSAGLIILGVYITTKPDSDTKMTYRIAAAIRAAER